MRSSRRQFLKTTLGAGLSAGLFQGSGPVAWAEVSAESDPYLYPPQLHLVFRDDEEYMAFSTAAPYAPYLTKEGPKDACSWMQVDLGASRAFDQVKLYPAIANFWGFRTDRFPKRFKIEASNEADFRTADTIVDYTAQDYTTDALRICPFPAARTSRYVRLTITAFPENRAALGKIGVFSGGKDLAEGRPVTVDAAWGDAQAAARLTRSPRPMGENTWTDQPENVLPAGQWKPPGDKILAPLGGVTLGDGLFRETMERNIAYLLQSDTVDDLLAPFRERAGRPNPAGLKKPVRFWETYLPGSSAGRFLMGAGNTLRWMEHPELRRRLNAVVDGIKECRAPDGFIMAYPPDTMFDCERGGYTRSWLTQGLIEAGYAGRKDVFPLLRDYHDWLYRRPEMPRLMRGGGMGTQGMTPLTRFYFAPEGEPAEIHAVQRYFQENYWLEWLAQRRPEAIWLYPYDRPHNYLITNLEAYLDVYRATGAPRYLEAVLGGWDLYREHWQHEGGSIGITEFGEFPPDSNRIYAHGAGTQDGELCGSVFWTRLNQRLHLLFPEEEKYVTEIEKSIYNVGIAAQDGGRGIIYHARLVVAKEKSRNSNTCCEGQGTRLFGSLPEYIYSTAPDGIYVDLFEPSAIEWTVNGRRLKLEMSTRFPYDPAVRLTFSGGAAVPAKIRVRVPSWVSAPLAITVNQDVAATGKAGSYVTLDRSWSEGDSIAFTLPMAFQLTRYRGVSEVPGQPFYVLRYGPILMAATGRADVRFQVGAGKEPQAFLQKLRPIPEQPLHFAVAEETVEYRPYFELPPSVPLTCYPVITCAKA